MIEYAPTSRYLNYNDALLYCHFLEYNDHRDWRMPTLVECKRYKLWGWHVDDNDAGLDDTLLMCSTVTPVRDV